MIIILSTRPVLGCPSGLRGQTQVSNHEDFAGKTASESVLVVTDCVGSNPTLSSFFFFLCVETSSDENKFFSCFRLRKPCFWKYPSGRLQIR